MGIGATEEEKNLRSTFSDGGICRNSFLIEALMFLSTMAESILDNRDSSVGKDRC